MENRERAGAVSADGFAEAAKSPGRIPRPHARACPTTAARRDPFSSRAVCPTYGHPAPGRARLGRPPSGWPLGASLPPAGRAPTPRQLPADVHSFVNRTDELAQLDAVLTARDGGQVVVSVHVVAGTAGAGKTSLARALIGVWKPARGTIRLDGATLD